MAYARLALVHEELHELAQAINNRDLTSASKEVVDVIYTAIGIGVEMGLPLDELWKEVHESNMKKVMGPGKRGDSDIIKPEGWRGPSVATILQLGDRDDI